MKRAASAVWNGDIKSGRGEVSSRSGALAEAHYAFASRFEDGSGTNPEELVAAAQASCYAMALSLVLGESGENPEHINAEAAVTINAVHLDVSAVVPDVSESDFQAAAEKTKTICPVSKLFNTDITLKPTLAG